MSVPPAMPGGFLMALVGVGVVAIFVSGKSESVLPAAAPVQAPEKVPEKAPVKVPEKVP